MLEIYSGACSRSHCSNLQASKALHVLLLLVPGDVGDNGLAGGGGGEGSCSSLFLLLI